LETHFSEPGSLERLKTWMIYIEHIHKSLQVASSKGKRVHPGRNLDVLAYSSPLHGRDAFLFIIASTGQRHGRRRYGPESGRTAGLLSEGISITSGLDRWVIRAIGSRGTHAQDGSEVAGRTDRRECVTAPQDNDTHDKYLGQVGDAVLG
jgi:hypothetical protein